MNDETKTDEELMASLKANHMEAFEILYDRHHQRLWNYFQKRSPSRGEDLFQECFARLIERREQWSGQPFLAWMFVMARNLFIDDFRREKNRHTKEFNSISAPETVEIDDWLEGLPVETQNQLREHYLEGRSYQELALKYETKEVTLRQKFSRAFKAIRKELT